jgi:molybdopterin converting factor small subunit
MAIQVLLFASWAEALGPTLSLDLPAGSRVRDVLASLRARAGDRPLPTPLVAVNQRYVREDAPVAGADEVAIIPPVAGG